MSIKCQLNPHCIPGFDCEGLITFHSVPVLLLFPPNNEICNLMQQSSLVLLDMSFIFYDFLDDCGFSNLILSFRFGPKTLLTFRSNNDVGFVNICFVLQRVLLDCSCCVAFYGTLNPYSIRPQQGLTFRQRYYNSTVNKDKGTLVPAHNKFRL